MDAVTLLHSSEMLNIVQNKALGVFIVRSDGDQFHTGFVFRKGLKELAIAHVAWKDRYYVHNLLDAYSSGVGGLWMSSMSDQNKQLVLLKLHSMSVKDPKKIRYGVISSGKAVIDENADYVPDPETEGDSLTCAVFVLCILESIGIKVVERSSWTLTEQDKSWQEQILDKLTDWLHPEFLKIQRNGVGRYPRFSPHQVIGSCCVYNHVKKSVNYDTAEQAARKVEAEIQRLGL
jgi:hypothetical protein